MLLTRIYTIIACFAAACIATAPIMSDAVAEEAIYGAIDLTGKARASWNLNPPGYSNTMVCNVNGDDGWLALRSGPGTNFSIKRKFYRLALFAVDTSRRSGHWVRVSDVSRSFNPEGIPMDYINYNISGWAHDGFLCDFLD